MIWLVLLTFFLVCTCMSVVFCVYLCLLWSAAIRNPPPSDPSSGNEKPPRGLSAAQLEALPGAADGAAAKGAECAVCLDDVEPGQPARLLPFCNHAFHRTCADKWLAAEPNCPVCRAAVLPPAPPPPPPELESIRVDA